jgi:hypothetical protein
MSIATAVPRFAFITCICGGYEKTCKPFVKQTIDSDFICFTDNPSIQANGWIIDTEMYFHTHKSPLDKGSFINSLENNKNTFNIAKYFKEQWHLVPRLKEYTHVVWLDGTMSIIHEEFASHLLSIFTKGEKVITIDHDWRHGFLFKEAKSSMPPYQFRYFCNVLNSQYQPLQDVSAQYEEYLADGYDEDAWKQIKPDRPHYGVFVTCVVAWPNTDETKNFLDLWYMQNLMYTTQDQVAFPYCCKKLGTQPYTFPDEVSGGDQFTNKFFKKLEHGV